MIKKLCRNSHRATIRVGALTAAGVIAASVVAGCGGSSASASGSDGGGGGGDKGGLKTLTVAVPGATSAYGDLFVAQQEGYFKDEGLNVKFIVGPVSATVAYLQSGRADLVEWGPSAAVSAADKGLKTKVINANLGDAGLALVGSPKTTSIAQVKAKPNCRFGAPPVGSISYSWAITYVKKLGLKNCKISQVSDTSALTSATMSGQYDLMVDAYTAALAVKDAGGHIFEDPSTAEFKREFQSDGQFANILTFGTSDNLAKKKPQIEGFLRASAKAHDVLATQSIGIDKLVKDMESVQGFAIKDPKLIKEDLNFNKPFFAQKFGGPTGYIDEASWKLALESLKNYGLTGYTPSDAVNSYAQRVDMSYLKDAGSK